MRSEKLPILTYHSLDESRSVISTSPSMFKNQMGFLWKNGYQTLSISELRALLHKGTSIPPKKLVITFDDGYKSTYIHAFPILKTYGFSGTIFLVNKYCGKMNDWPSNSASIEHTPLLSWSEIKEMNNYGFEVGAHTLNHPDLTRITTKQAEKEIVESKLDIEDHVGAEVKVFAYPYGKYDRKTKGIVQREFGCACSTRLGKVQADCDPYLLKRIDMYYVTRFRFFRALSSRPMDLYLGMRQVFRHLRELT